MTEPVPMPEGEERPPRGVRAMAAVRWGILLVVAAIASVSVYGAAATKSAADESAHHHPRYRCPMHPQITSDVPGECPICHMTLEPIPEELLPAVPSGAPPSAPRAPRGTSPATPPAATPKETARVELAFDRAQAIGVRTEAVEMTASGESLHVAAAVEAPERSAAEVHVRTPGFLETTAVREVGEKVRAGQTLATVYSAEVYQAEQELLAVLEWKQGGAGGPPPVEDAKRRLELLSVPRATIDRIAEKREAIRAIAVASPIDGFVVRKSAVLGSYVTPELSLFDIVGLDRVYVVASVDPSVLGSVRPGTLARFSTPSLPGRTFDAAVDLVYPTMDPVARTARVRFSLKNADLSLRPGQVGMAELAAAGSPALTVPLDAVVQTGREAYVFVAEGAGRYSPRTVEVGEERGERVVVRGELSPGDRVVSRATFLVDSDSRIRASFERKAGP